MWVIHVLRTLVSHHYCVFIHKRTCYSENAHFWIALLHPRSQTLSKVIYSKMDFLIKTRRLSWYIAAACMTCRSGSESPNWIYFSTIPHRLWWWFFNNNRKYNKQTPGQLGWSVQKQSWTTTRVIPVQDMKTMENPDWPFRRRSQGKQQLTFWSDRGRKF